MADSEVPELDLQHLRETQVLAVQLLQQFIRPVRADWPRLFALIRPQEEDWDTVFLPEFVARAREGYQSLIDDGVIPESNPGQTELRLTACAPAFLLQSDNPVSRLFPGGYRRIASALRPDPVWCCWKFVQPGHRAGMAHNGLVRVAKDRFAWFPKPWRVLGP